ncbi:MAG TPA: non-homologous end-joining DNA ligase [Desulfosarcina sp.]|nr:non-homologous end-joining DNA ligase [Desulfosarcina sp.]
MSDTIINVDGHAITVSNPDKVLFPDDGLTKADLADYDRRIAPIALPHFRNRPVTMQRFPDGIDGEGFFQKNIPDYFPDWIERVELPKEGGTVRHVLVSSAAALVYLANQGCITPHLGVAPASTPDRPDRLVFDLDPSDDDFGKVQMVARALKDLFDGWDLTCFVQTTGSRGLHIVLPLDGSADFDTLRPFARRVAERIAADLPQVATDEQRKAKRGDRVLVDTFRTAYGQTSVAPYAVRARPGAPVATPLRWAEALDPGMGPRKYTMANIFRRTGQIGDPWADIARNPLRADRLPGLPS